MGNGARACRGSVITFSAPVVDGRPAGLCSTSHFHWEVSGGRGRGAAGKRGPAGQEGSMISSSGESVFGRSKGALGLLMQMRFGDFRLMSVIHDLQSPRLPRT